MAKQYFKLTGDYEGLIARRIAQSGRLWLVRVINDGRPYYFVFIRGFDPQARQSQRGEIYRRLAFYFGGCRAFQVRGTASTLSTVHCSSANRETVSGSRKIYAEATC